MVEDGDQLMENKARHENTDENECKKINEKKCKKISRVIFAGVINITNSYGNGEENRL